MKLVFHIDVTKANSKVLSFYDTGCSFQLTLCSWVNKPDHHQCSNKRLQPNRGLMALGNIHYTGEGGAQASCFSRKFGLIFFIILHKNTCTLVAVQWLILALLSHFAVILGFKNISLKARFFLKMIFFDWCLARLWPQYLLWANFGFVSAPGPEFVECCKTLKVQQYLIYV